MKNLTPEEIGKLAKTLRDHYSAGTVDELADLALDGLRFRFWIELASTRPSAVVDALLRCTKVEDYRRAIDGLIVKTKREERG